MDKELYELANPVSRTAVATLIQLAAAGYEKSGEVLLRLGFHQDEYSWSLGDADNLERICMVANRESRYVALNNVALESGCDIIYDLPCGFIHRAFDMVEKGKTYVGGDLPAVISSIQPVINDIHGQYDLRSFSFLKDDVIEKLRKALSNVNVWKLTVNPDFVSENPGSPEKNFSLQTKHDGETLSFILTGRMDSLSAPLLLDAWEKESVAQTVQKVIIDCNNLQYVSSAGLRVLMMIKKALPEAPLVLMNVNRPVKEILVTTGFIGLFEIHCKDNNRNDN